MMRDIRKILDKEKEEILFLERKLQCFEYLTEKRMQLIRTITHRSPDSIRELAEFLNRDVKNVFDDLQLLNDMGVINFVRFGRKKKPIVRRKFIIISLE